MKLCATCGNAASDDALFCGACGASLSASSEGEAAGAGRAGVAAGEQAGRGLPMERSEATAQEAKPASAIGEEEMQKQLADYVLPSSAPLIAILASLACALAFGFAMAILRGILFFFIVLFLPLFIALACWEQASFCLQASSSLKRLQVEGRLEEAYEDFLHAQRFDNDAIRFGDVYCFGRGATAIPRYSDVRRIWVYTKTVNFAFVDGAIMIEERAWDKRRICTLSKKQCDDQWYLPVLLVFKSKNESIVLGN